MHILGNDETVLLLDAALLRSLSLLLFLLLRLLLLFDELLFLCSERTLDIVYRMTAGLHRLYTLFGPVVEMCATCFLFGLPVKVGIYLLPCLLCLFALLLKALTLILFRVAALAQSIKLLNSGHCIGKVLPSEIYPLPCGFCIFCRHRQLIINGSSQHIKLCFGVEGQGAYLGHNAVFHDQLSRCRINIGTGIKNRSLGQVFYMLSCKLRVIRQQSQRTVLIITQCSSRSGDLS